MARLCLTDDDAKVRHWLREEVEKLDCTVTVDQMGNMFARQRGSLGSPAPMTAMGSHLDTQPRGGRYDGILGVLAALEVLRTMKENGFRTNFDIGLVNWTKYVFTHRCSFSCYTIILMTKPITVRKVLDSPSPCAPRVSGQEKPPSRKPGD